MLQRQNSAPVVQPQQQQPSQFNDFYKPNNVNKAPSTASSGGQQQPPEIQRKYSLPNTAIQQQSSASTVKIPSSYNSSVLSNIRKQSAPAITSFPAESTSTITTSIQQPLLLSTSSQQQLNNNFQQVAHGSPSRARDRNLFDKVPLNQDALIQIQLPLLKGYFF